MQLPGGREQERRLIEKINEITNELLIITADVSLAAESLKSTCRDYQECQQFLSVGFLIELVKRRG